MDDLFYQYDLMTLDELIAEKDILTYAITNEKIWQFGCDGISSEVTREQNLEALKDALAYVQSKIEEKEAS